MLHGATISRACSCRHSSLTCPVHVLGSWIEQWPAGTQPFAHIKPSNANKTLRRRLSQSRVAHAFGYCMHDFRRGHAKDTVTNGDSLATILKAGGWRSAAFQAYIDLSELETSAVLEAQWALSEDEEV